MRLSVISTKSFFLLLKRKWWKILYTSYLKSRRKDHDGFGKGYLAAIIDGEGTVTLTKDSSFRYPTIEVSSTTLEIVEYLKDHFGGVISRKNERSPKWK